ncbi:MAG TPA: hypothetical protein PKD70_00185 [Saprospiraceae bacterium]|nr:hypothetical protein [Saprospiraceae bacterium]HMP12262.1 hypothetical protein [Saprospiraceae bacterium]
MAWYILSGTTNRKITGMVYPQAESVPTEVPYSIAIYSDYMRGPAPEDIFVPKFKLCYRAKLTEMVSVAMFIFPTQSIISEKFFHILKNFHSPPYQAFPTSVFDRKGIEHPYFVFMQNAPQFHAADYERSVFSRIASMKENGYEYIYEDFQASDYEEVRLLKGRWASALYIKEDIEWDFFLLAAPPFLWMVNEKVAEALRAANITGICLIPFQQGDDWVNDELFMRVMRIEQPEWGGHQQTNKIT